MIADAGFTERCNCRLYKCKYCTPDYYPSKELATLRSQVAELTEENKEMHEDIQKFLGEIAEITRGKELLKCAAFAAYSELQNGRPKGAKTMLRTGIRGGSVNNALDLERFDIPLDKAMTPAPEEGE